MLRSPYRVVSVPEPSLPPYLNLSFLLRPFFIINSAVMDSPQEIPITFGIEIEFIADVRGVLPPDHEFIGHLSSTQKAAPWKTLEHVGKAIKARLQGTAGLAHPVALTETIANQKAPLHEDETQFKAWIIKDEFSINVGSESGTSDEAGSKAGSALYDAPESAGYGDSDSSV